MTNEPSRRDDVQRRRTEQRHKMQVAFAEHMRALWNGRRWPEQEKPR